eukprot:1366209-Amphidinium_carterae.2
MDFEDSFTVNNQLRKALTSTDRPSMVGRGVANPIISSTPPDAPSAGRGGKVGLVCADTKVIQAEMVGNANADDGGWNWSGTQGEDFPGGLDIDMLPLTPIDELHMHREPDEEVTEIQHHETFEGGRSHNRKCHVCCRCTQRYVFSAMAWVKNEYDRVQKGVIPCAIGGTQMLKAFCVYRRRRIPG